MSWGLPIDYADFYSLVKHALDVSGGEKALFLSAHQGDWESAIAQDVYRKLGIPFGEMILEPSEFEGLWPSTHPVHVIVSRHF